jgi:HupE/UreJ protein
MTRGRIASLLLAALCLLANSAALSHKPSDSYLTVRADGPAIEGQWDIALRDLDLAVGLDNDGDAILTWGEVRDRHAQIAAYALGRLAIRKAGEVCSLWPTAHLVDEHTDGMYAVMRFSGACPGGAGALVISYGLLFDLDAQHRGLLKLEAHGGVRSAVFSAEDHSRTFQSGDADRLSRFASFVADGVKHIAIGPDHILFLVALLLPAVMVRVGRAWHPASDLRTTLWNVIGIVSAFTLAHSITLSLAALEIVSVPSRLVESLIALSVLLTALDNIVPFLPRRRWLIAFAFGLAHGLGFASVLLDLQLPRAALALSLLGFNLGVEIGQLVLVSALVPVAHFLRGRPSYGRYALGLGSAAIASVALGWAVERAFEFNFMPF